MVVVISNSVTVCFIPEKGEITSLFSKNIKRARKKLKKCPILQFCNSENPEYSGKVACLKL